MRLTSTSFPQYSAQHIYLIVVDEIVAASNLYGGTFTMFKGIFPQFGIHVRMVTANDFDGLSRAINPKTRAVFIEAIGNPTLEVSDIEAYARIAHENHVPLIVDATFTTPFLLRPIEHGADIVVHSLTQWLGGHGAGIGGMVVFGIEGGRKAAERFINGLTLFSHVANVGDAKSLAIHPASTTHSQLNDESLQAGGVHPELIRLSIGIEHIDDILTDINQALELS